MPKNKIFQDSPSSMKESMTIELRGMSFVKLIQWFKQMYNHKQ